MSITLKKQRNGETWRPFWYGVYINDAGDRKVVNLNTKWRGTPPTSLRESGDAAFENSREKAEAALKIFTDDARRKGRATHLVERLIEEKTGAAPEYTKIADLRDRWLSGDSYSVGYIGQCKALFQTFSSFMQARNPKALYLHQVTKADAQAFADETRARVAPKTYKSYIGILKPAFDRLLPNGAENPFGKIKTKKGGEKDAGTVHRIPFTEHELEELIEAAGENQTMQDLIITAACTGMRRGDVCQLRWEHVDLSAQWLTVKTSKTGENADLPIFARLRPVLEQRNGNGSEYVFPEAARMYAENPDGVTYRFKKIVAQIFTDADTSALPELIDPATIEDEALRAITENTKEGPRQKRISEAFRRYSTGESVREIEKAIGVARSTVSADLHAVETWTGTRFIRNVRSRSIKQDIARTTRIDRKQGQRAASVRDWHALRTTFVTIALTNGADIETIQRITGHRTVSIVLKHYYRPDREQHRAKVTAALPASLTGAKKHTQLNPAAELAAIAEKLAAGTATKQEKARLQTLAANV
jgi:integrase